MKNQSSKQRKRQRLLSERKRARIERELEERGFVRCEGEDCVKTFLDVDSAMAWLQGHHRKHRGMGYSGNREGIDDDENILLLCDHHHKLAHG